MYLSSVSASCPTWFYYNNTTQQCECGAPFSGKVHCNQQERKAEIENGFCATSTEQEGQYYAGYCPLRHTENKTDRMFSELPSDPDLLNDTMCGPYNRKGLLCGRCIDGYGPAVYSLNMKCANCSRLSTGYAISLYLVLEFIPITLFFICVVIFRLDITAGPLLGYVLFCQAYVFVILYEDLYIYDYILSHVSAPIQMLFYSSLTLSGSWTLQFGKFTTPPFCISEKLTGIHIQMLSLVSSIYPLVLVIITCILMELHSRNCRIIWNLWKPFNVFPTKLKIPMATTDAVIHAFATLILLTATTLTYNMSAIATNTPVYRSIGSTLYKTVVYSDPTIVWFSHKHILYMLAAVVPFILLVLIPSLLLCVYPTRIYGCLSRFVSARKRLSITAFAEALHNCFKSGLNGTRDYRALAGLFTLGSVVYALTVSVALKNIVIGYSSDTVGGYGLVFISFTFSYMRPCKSTIANLSLSYHYMMAGILSIALNLWKRDLSTGTETLAGTIVIIPAISHILVFTWAMYTLTHRIMSHFGCQFNRANCKITPTDLVNVVKWYFQRRCGGYQEIPDTATDM